MHNLDRMTKSTDEAARLFGSRPGQSRYSGVTRKSR